MPVEQEYVTSHNVVTITPAAIKHAKYLRAKKGDETLGVRIGVKGGGCSGFQYKFDLVGTTEADDIVIEREGARLLIDQMSLGYLDGAAVDFVDDLMGATFRVTNPNATASCGCGTSFSI